MIINEDLCIGCKSCIMACPFGIIGYDYEKGVSRKCDLCEGDPKCVLFCETNALRYERPEIAETRRQASVLDALAPALSKRMADVVQKSKA